MQRLSHLPPPPHFDIEVVGDAPSGSPHFLRRISRALVVREEGQASASFIYDEIDRKSLDAVVVAAHFMAHDEEGVNRRYVVLRSAVRPPVVLRDAARSGVEEPKNRALWELPAGLVEVEEQSPEGLGRAAARELFEETGFLVDAHALQPLGPSAFPAPGVMSERQFFFHVPVDPAKQCEPSLDGSPLEAAGELVAVPLRVALDAARLGRLADAKTELALRRLLELLEEVE